jgi:hypothetical protein
MKRFIHEWWMHIGIASCIAAIWYVALVHP